MSRFERQIQAIPTPVMWVSSGKGKIAPNGIRILSGSGPAANWGLGEITEKPVDGILTAYGLSPVTANSLAWVWSLNSPSDGWQAVTGLPAVGFSDSAVYETCFDSIASRSGSPVAGWFQVNFNQSTSDQISAKTGGPVVRNGDSTVTQDRVEALSIKATNPSIGWLSAWVSQSQIISDSAATAARYPLAGWLYARVDSTLSDSVNSRSGQPLANFADAYIYTTPTPDTANKIAGLPVTNNFYVWVLQTATESFASFSSTPTTFNGTIFVLQTANDSTRAAASPSITASNGTVLILQSTSDAVAAKSDFAVNFGDNSIKLTAIEVGSRALSDVPSVAFGSASNTIFTVSSLTTFDYWLQGAPLIPTCNYVDFSAWMTGGPVYYATNTWFNFSASETILTKAKLTSVNKG